MRKMFPFFILSLVTLTTSLAQAVRVTVALDKPAILVGETTRLRAYGEITPALQESSDRIFAWFVDAVNSDSATAAYALDSLRRPNSDNDPRTSSSGSVVAGSIRAIYDTFIQAPDAGKNAPVELFNVAVTGMKSGTVRLEIAPGSLAEVGPDFLVAPVQGGDPFLGGDYSNAFIVLSVTAPDETSKLAIQRTANGVTITFEPKPGFDHAVEFVDSLTAPAAWTVLPGAPHNTGVVTDSISASGRFYRLKANPAL